MHFSRHPHLWEARLLSGGDVTRDDRLRGGFFFEPTLFDGGWAWPERACPSVPESVVVTVGFSRGEGW